MLEKIDWRFDFRGKIFKKFREIDFTSFLAWTFFFLALPGGGDACDGDGVDGVEQVQRHPM